MKTITFYSFKGGVGRSLTLSNMALWLADEMKAKVCVIDFDLEAPGLPYKFEDLQNPTDQERLAKTEGIVEYIDEFKQTGIPPTDFARFYLPFTTKKGNPITLIPAGNLQQSDYWRKLFEINWQKLFEHDPAMGYSQGLLLLEDLKGRIENELAPDFLLIDSRTGLTEIASITLKLMADKAVLVGINNPENQDGLFWVLRSLHADPSSCDLPYHLVLNRVPMQDGIGGREIDPREKAISEHFLKCFKSLAPQETLAKRFSIIHVDDELAFGEKLQEGFYVEAQPKVQVRKDYWDVFTQVVKEYFNSDQWALFENKRKAYELYYKAKFDTIDIQEQINLMNKAIYLCDDDAFLYNYRFIKFNTLGNFEAARSDIEKVIALEPNIPLWYFNLEYYWNQFNDRYLTINNYQDSIKILIADDKDLLLFDTDSLLFRGNRYQIVNQCSSIEETLSFISQKSVDIIITDLHFKERTGLELVLKIRKINPKQKILIRTSEDHLDYIREAINAGVNGYILRSDGEKKLLLAIEEVCRIGAYFSPMITRILSQMPLKHKVLEGELPLAYYKLTPKEKEVLMLIAKSETNSSIMNKLNIGAPTLATHRQSLKEKLRENTDVGLALFAFKYGLVKMD